MNCHQVLWVYVLWVLGIFSSITAVVQSDTVTGKSSDPTIDAPRPFGLYEVAESMNSQLVGQRLGFKLEIQLVVGVSDDGTDDEDKNQKS